MGDMADWIVDNSIFGEWCDEYEYEPSLVTCKYCHQSGFIWKETKHKKWWLWDVENDKWHNCEADKRSV